MCDIYVLSKNKLNCDKFSLDKLVEVIYTFPAEYTHLHLIIQLTVTINNLPLPLFLLVCLG